MDESVQQEQQAGSRLQSQPDSVSDNYQYLKKMEKNGQWGDGVMLSAATKLYDRKIIVVLADNTLSESVPIQLSTDTNDNSIPIYLGFVKDMKHYVHLTPAADKLCDLSLQQHLYSLSNTSAGTRAIRLF